MKIDAIDIFQLRNMPVPSSGKGPKRKKLPVPDHGFSTVLQIAVMADDKTRHVGLGEIRAIPYLTGETPEGAYAAAQRLADALVGRDLPQTPDGMDAARTTAALVSAALHSAMGIADSDPLPPASHPAVRLAFDTALLDVMACVQGKTVTALLGGDTAPVRRNTFTRNFAKPSLLLNALMKGNRPHGWLRGSFPQNGTNLAAATGAICAATSGSENDLAGVWYDLKGRWTLGDVENMLDGMGSTNSMRGSSLSMLLEQPFASHATAWYADLVALLKKRENPLGDNLRVMVEIDPNSPAGLDAVLGDVDIKITPQKCGSVADLLELLKAVRAKGFKGRVYLGNAGMNTELNSILLVTLAQVIGAQVNDGDVLLSANYKPEDDAKIRQVYPQVTADSEDPCLLTPPDAPGWGAMLCQSVLSKRLRKQHFVRTSMVAPDKDSLKALTLMRAFDDSKLHIQQLDFGDEDADTVDDDESETDTL